MAALWFRFRTLVVIVVGVVGTKTKVFHGLFPE